MADINSDSQTVINTLISISRYLIWINSDKAAASIIEDIKSAAICSLSHIDVELAQHHASKWESIADIAPQLICNRWVKGY